MDKDKLKTKLRTLKQYQGISEEDLDKIVQRKIESDELKENFKGFKKTEIERALTLYYKYLDENSFESLAEKSTLINLVYLETLTDRIKEFIDKEGEDKQGAISQKMVEQLIMNNTQIMSLKEKLGMLKDKENETALNIINELKEKALIYYNEHAGCTTIRCPNCQELFNLLMDVNNLTPEKSSFFKGTLLYNKPLLNLYHQKRITKEEVANILGVHQNYVDFIYNNLYLKELKQNE